LSEKWSRTKSPSFVTFDCSIWYGSSTAVVDDGVATVAAGFGFDVVDDSFASIAIGVVMIPGGERECTVSLTNY